MARLKMRHIAVGIVVLAAVCLVVYAVTGLTITTAWAVGWQHATGDLAGAEVFVAPQPHACDLTAAPLGFKRCHYEKELHTLRIRRTAQGQDVSTDDGKTWAPAAPTMRPAIVVYWRRVNDE